MSRPAGNFHPSVVKFLRAPTRSTPVTRKPRRPKCVDLSLIDAGNTLAEPFQRIEVAIT